MESISDQSVLNRSRHRKGDARMSVDRLPPHDLQMEIGVLGCCLLDPPECVGMLLVVCGKNAAHEFYDLRHQTIAGVLLAMYDEQVPIDITTVQERLKKIEMLENVGGIVYLSELQDAVPSAANLSYYLTRLREKSKLRQLVKVCSGIVSRVYEREGGDAEQLMVECEAEISRLTEAETPATEEHIGRVLGRVVNDMEENRYIRGRQQLRGLPTGPLGNYLDKLVRGIRDTYYFVVAGRPGDGKTSLVMNWVEFLANDYVWHEKTGRQIPQQTDAEEEMIPETVERKGIPIGVFSIEMDADSLGYRLLFGRAQVDSAEFSQGFASAADQARLVQASMELNKSKIYIDATPAQSIGQIAAKARRMVKQYGIKLFVLDYLQLVEQEGGNGFDRVKELTKISRKIMALKKQLKVPWIVLAQMNRNIETTESKRAPVLSDLKDCGAIEQDCDAALFLYKPSRKEIEDSGDKDVLDAVCGAGTAESPWRDGWSWAKRPYRVNFMLAKNRFGPTGVVQMLFCKNLCRFEDWHLWKVRHGAEERNAGESKRLEAPKLPSSEEMGI